MIRTCTTVRCLFLVDLTWRVVCFKQVAKLEEKLSREGNNLKDPEVQLRLVRNLTNMIQKFVEQRDEQLAVLDKEHDSAKKQVHTSAPINSALTCGHLYWWCCSVHCSLAFASLHRSRVRRLAHGFRGGFRSSSKIRRHAAWTLTQLRVLPSMSPI